MCTWMCACVQVPLVICFQVSVRTVDGVQGLEFRTLIISTVRTCSLLGDNEEDAGFLSNPKVWSIHVLFSVICLPFCVHA